MKRITAYVLDSGRSSAWLRQCLKSLDHPAIEAVVLPRADGLDEIHYSRYVCWSDCATEFFTFVDDDDWIETTVIDHMLKRLDDHPEVGGAYTEEMLVDSIGTSLWKRQLHMRRYRPKLHSVYPYEAHHLTVLRKSAAEKAVKYAPLDCKDYLSVLTLFGLVGALSGLIPIPRVGYYWRKHTANESTNMPSLIALQKSQAYLSFLHNAKVFDNDTPPTPGVWIARLRQLAFQPAVVRRTAGKQAV